MSQLIERLQSIISAFDDDVTEELASASGERADLWTEVDVPVGLLREALSALTQPSPNPVAAEEMDEALTLAKDEGADFVLGHLARALGLKQWVNKDGSESWDGDVHATLMGILYDAKVLDEDNNRVPSPAAAGGYVLVPVEPTPEMIEAGVHAGVTASPLPWCPVVYRAMLSARPSIGETVPGAGEPHYPSLSEAYSTALEAAEVYYDAASEEEAKWTGWGDQIVPFYAEMRRIKAKQALSALRDAELPAPLASTQEGEAP